MPDGGRRDPAEAEDEFFETDPWWIDAPAMIGDPADYDGMGDDDNPASAVGVGGNDDDVDDGWGLRTR